MATLAWNWGGGAVCGECVLGGACTWDNLPLQLRKALAGKLRQAGPGAPMIHLDHVSVSLVQTPSVTCFLSKASTFLLLHLPAAKPL